MDLSTSQHDVNSPEHFGIMPGDPRFDTFEKDFPAGNPAAPAPEDFQDTEEFPIVEENPFIGRHDEEFPGELEEHIRAGGTVEGFYRPAETVDDEHELGLRSGYDEIMGRAWQLRAAGKVREAAELLKRHHLRSEELADGR